MFPEIEIGSRPSGLFWVLLLRVVVQGVLGSTEAEMVGVVKQRDSRAEGQRSNGAAGQRGSGEAAQRSSGEAEQRQIICVGQRDGARLWPL